MVQAGLGFGFRWAQGHPLSFFGLFANSRPVRSARQGHAPHTPRSPREGRLGDRDRRRAARDGRALSSLCAQGPGAEADAARGPLALRDAHRDARRPNPKGVEGSAGECAGHHDTIDGGRSGRGRANLTEDAATVETRWVRLQIFGMDRFLRLELGGDLISSQTLGNRSNDQLGARSRRLGAVAA